MTILLILLVAAARPIRAAEDQGSDVWYEAGALDPELLEPDRRQELETPRGLMTTFLDLTDSHRFEEAARLLHQGEQEHPKTGRNGARLAEMLAGILHRRVVIDWGALPDRPDGMNTDLPSNHPFAGKPRRTLAIGELTVEGRPLAITISRYKPDEGDAIWLFSPQTAANVPRLHALYGPGWLVELIPASLKIEAVGPVRLWEIVLLPLLATLFLGLVMSLRAIIGWSAEHFPASFIRRASRKIRTPLAVAVTAFALREFLDASLSFSGPINAVLTPALLAALIFCVTLAVLRTIDTSLDIVTDRYVGDLDTKDDSDRRHLYTNIYAARRYVLLIAVVVTIVVILMQLNLFDSLGMSLLASAGVATVVLGIAGQTVLGNLLASLQIAIAKPIRIGDAVFYEGNWCYVEAIYYTFITLRAWDSRRVIVPVKYFISQPFENWTMTDAKTTRSFTMELDLNADPDELRAVFEDVVREEEHFMEDEFRLVAVEGYDQTTQKLTFYATADSPSEAWMMNTRLAEKMGDWVRRNRPEWWPRLRLAADGSARSGVSAPHAAR